MGILDSFINILKGSARKTIDVSLDPGEHELDRAFAVTSFGRTAKTNGQLILTNQRLIFSPWSMKDMSVLLGAALPATGLPAVTGSLPGAAVNLLGGPVGIPLTDITAVTVSQGASWFRPPSIFVAMGMAQAEFNVLASYASLPPAPNIRARDTFAKALTDAAAAARR